MAVMVVMAEQLTLLMATTLMPMAAMAAMAAMVVLVALVALAALERKRVDIIMHSMVSMAQMVIAAFHPLGHLSLSASLLPQKMAETTTELM